MMNRIYTGIFISLLAAATVSAQGVERTISTIRTHYSEISEKARLAEADEDQGAYGGLIMNELTINKLDHQWRAVGIYNITYKFFYNESGDEKRLYPDQLKLVKTHRRISARVYYEEYLYADDGSLMFCFQRSEGDDEVPRERRVYFTSGKPIRVIDDEKKRDRMTAADTAAAKKDLDLGRKLKDLFTSSIKL